MFILAQGAILGTNFLYEDALFDASNELIGDWQDENSFWADFYKIAGIAGEEYGVSISYFIFLAILPYSEIIFVLITVGFAAYLSGLHKQLLHDGRPYWVSDKVDAIYCNILYGNPSGHAVYFFSVIPTIFYLLFYAKTRDRYSIGWNYYTHSKWYWAFYWITLILIIFIGIPSTLSRLYLGAHTIDQMIYGALIGSVTFVYSIFILREPLLLYAYKFVERKCTLREAILHSIYII